MIHVYTCNDFGDGDDHDQLLTSSGSERQPQGLGLLTVQQVNRVKG